MLFFVIILPRLGKSYPDSSVPYGYCGSILEIIGEVGSGEE